MRRAVGILFIATACAAEARAAEPAAASSSLRRVYLRAETPDARGRVAPFAAREFPGGIVSAALPAAALEALAASGITIFGDEALFHPVPFEAQEVQLAAGPRAAGDETRPCYLPGFIRPVGWGIKSMYNDPALTRTSGGAGVKVAVIDGGVSPHLDVVRRLAKCVDLTSLLDAPPCADSTFHGTSVASIIAADGGFDGLGMWGMAPEAQIYSYRVCEPNGECWGSYIAAGIHAAIADGVNIINMSLAGPGHDPVVRAAIDSAVAHNILVVVAGGNSPPFSYLGYPAVYPEVVSVGAVTESGSPWPYSAVGVNDGDYVREDKEVELAAPGVSVLAALKTGCWWLGSGTSLAAPHVAGLAAKLWDGDAASMRIRLQAGARLRDLYIAGDDTLTGFGEPAIASFFTIATTAGPGGAVTPGGALPLAAGASQTFTVAAFEECFRIQDVVVDGVSQGPVTSYTFANVAGNHTLVANFSARPLTIRASAGPGGSISPNGGSTVPCGSDLVYAITPSDACHAVQNVFVDGLQRGPSPIYVFRNVTTDHTIEATFAVVGTRTITSGASAGGTISPGGVTVVPCGGSRQYSIVPSAGCSVIQNVQVDGISRGPITAYTFTNVTTDRSIFATFQALGPRLIESSAGPGGTISPAGAVSLPCGASQRYTIAPSDPCHVIQNVLIDGTWWGPITSHTFTDVRVYHSIHATFTALGPFTIQASAAPGTSISPSGVDQVPCGATRTYTISVPDACRAVRDVLVDGVPVGAVTSYTFRDVQGHHTISVSSAPSILALTETHADASWTATGEGSIDLRVGGGVPPYAYEWSNGATSQDLAHLSPGTYTARVTDATGCTNSLTVTIGLVGPDQPVLTRPVPNPTAGPLRLQYWLPAPAAVRLSVLDAQGREVAVLARGFLPAGLATATWNGETGNGRAPSGMYVIRMQAGGRSHVQKFALLR